jgi:hypothetical protein
LDLQAEVVQLLKKANLYKEVWKNY